MKNLAKWAMSGLSKWACCSSVCLVHLLRAFKLSLHETTLKSIVITVIDVVGFLRHLMDLCRLFPFQLLLLWRARRLGEVWKWHWLVIFVFVVLFTFSTLILFNTYVYVLSLCIKLCQKVGASTFLWVSSYCSIFLVEDCFRCLNQKAI